MVKKEPELDAGIPAACRSLRFTPRDIIPEMCSRKDGDSVCFTSFHICPIVWLFMVVQVADDAHVHALPT